jgi:hypothetical protein
LSSLLSLSTSKMINSWDIKSLLRVIRGQRIFRIAGSVIPLTAATIHLGNGVQLVAESSPQYSGLTTGVVTSDSKRLRMTDLDQWSLTLNTTDDLLAARYDDDGRYAMVDRILYICNEFSQALGEAVANDEMVRPVGYLAPCVKVCRPHPLLPSRSLDVDACTITTALCTMPLLLGCR